MTPSGHCADDGAPGDPRGSSAPGLLVEVGWSDRWAALLGEHPGAEPGRVLRHDGVAVTVRTATGDRVVPLRRGVEAPDGGGLAGARRRPRGRACSSGPRCCVAGPPAATARSSWPPTSTWCCSCAGSTARCGPAGSSGARRWRGTPGRPRCSCSPRPTWPSDLDGVLAVVDESHPGLEVYVTSATTGGPASTGWAPGWPGATSVLLGESGAGKSSLVNASAGQRRGRDRRGAGGRHQGPPHHHEPSAVPPVGRRGGHRHAGHPRGRPGRRRGLGRRHVHRHRGAGRALPLQRLRPRGRARLRGGRGGGGRGADGGSARPRSSRCAGRRRPPRSGPTRRPSGAGTGRAPRACGRTTSSTRAENGGDPGRQTRRSGSAARGHQSVEVHQAILARR